MQLTFTQKNFVVDLLVDNQTEDDILHDIVTFLLEISRVFTSIQSDTRYF